MNTVISIKTIFILAIAGSLPVGGALAQTSSPAPAPSAGSGPGSQVLQKLEGMTPQQRQAFLESHPAIRERLEHRQQELLGQYAQTPAAQQQQFLQSHPMLQQYVQSHPQAVARAEANAANARPGAVDPNHPRVNEVNQREENQQQRIAQGDASGTLTAGQTAKIEGEENKIQSQETADMDQHNGHLTKGEQGQLNREENRVSGQIYRDKHDVTPAGSAAPAGSGTASTGANGIDPGHPRVNEVNGRAQNQQNRIAQGISSGTLSSGQTARLERQEQRIKNQEARDMSQDGGHLKKSQQHMLNHEQNRESRRIYEDKH
jgi:hypothetical protein